MAVIDISRESGNENREFRNARFVIDFAKNPLNPLDRAWLGAIPRGSIITSLGQATLQVTGSIATALLMVKFPSGLILAPAGTVSTASIQKTVVSVAGKPSYRTTAEDMPIGVTVTAPVSAGKVVLTVRYIAPSVSGFLTN